MGNLKPVLDSSPNFVDLDLVSDAKDSVLAVQDLGLELIIFESRLESSRFYFFTPLFKVIFTQMHIFNYHNLL